MKTAYAEKKVKCDGGEIFTVPFTPIKDLFTFKAQAPIVVLGPTKGGKTVIALDVMYQFARQAHYVYYVSETAPSILDQKMSIVPSYFVRKPEEGDYYGCVARIWNDITSRGEAMKAEEQNLKPIFATLFPGEDIFARLKKHIEREGLKGAEASAAISEIIARLILDKVKQNPTVLNSFNQEQLNIVNSMTSTSIKSLLIFDDVTSILQKAQQEKGLVTVGKSSIRKGEAMKNMLEDMFTRARHYNCIILMFIHQLSAIDAKLYPTMSNFIFLNYNAALPLTRLQRMDCKYIKEIADKTKVFDKALYPWHVLFCDVQNRRMAVTCAEMHSDQIPIHPDVAKFHRILDSVQNGILQPSTISKVKDQPVPKQEVSKDTPKLSNGVMPATPFMMVKKEDGII